MDKLVEILFQFGQDQGLEVVHMKDDDFPFFHSFSLMVRFFSLPDDSKGFGGHHPKLWVSCIFCEFSPRILGEMIQFDLTFHIFFRWVVQPPTSIEFAWTTEENSDSFISTNYGKIRKLLSHNNHTIHLWHRWWKKSCTGDMVNIPLFLGLHTSQVVVWDFSHQQWYIYQHLP